MKTHILDELLKKIVDPNRCQPVGVFASDTVPSTFHSYPSCFISNTDPSHLSGQHWVAYYFTSPSTYEFFDSYGLNPSLYGLPYSAPETFNSLSLQSLDSAVCGQFCLYYLQAKCCGSTLDDIVHSFIPTSPKWNDRKVRKFIQRIHKPLAFYETHSQDQDSNLFQFVRNRLMK